MKRLLWAAAALAALLALAACGGKKSAESEAEEFRKELTKEDTTQMLALCNECMETLKAGRIDEALSRLYTYNDSTETVTPISEAKRAELKRTFRLFPVLGYEMDYYSFNSQGQNDVKYNIRFFEKTVYKRDVFVFTDRREFYNGCTVVKRACGRKEHLGDHMAFTAGKDEMHITQVLYV